MTAAYDLAPAGQLLAFGALIAAGPLLWWRQRLRAATPQARLRALTVLTLFLTFDLVLFGAFTRLTDSGLGCPDWPGCYAQSNPLAAHAEIHAAQTAMPSGPVTHDKAWVEMIHRYLAGAVGFLILVLCAMSWIKRGQGAISPWWSTVSLLWVCLQGAFGAWTVTMKLFPAIVTMHLILALGLLVLLAWQAQAYERRPLALNAGLRLAAWLVFVLVISQVALGGWVSTNYAVLACSDFPSCQAGLWWPETDFARGFTLWRHLGADADGGFLPFAALTAIHLAHRCGAAVVFTALVLFCWRLWRSGADGRVWAGRLLLIAGWQLLSGISNVVLDWPIAAALAHTGGAALLVTSMSFLLARLRQAH